MRSRRSRATEDTFDLVFLDAEKDDYEALFALARPLLEPGGLVVADNVLSHAETLGAYSAARQADPTLSSVTVPLDRGLELSVVLVALTTRCGRVASSSAVRRSRSTLERAEHLGVSSIRSKCVCWRYRGKEVVRLER